MSYVQYQEEDPATELVALLLKAKSGGEWKGDAHTAQLIQTAQYAPLLENLAPLLAGVAGAASSGTTPPPPRPPRPRPRPPLTFSPLYRLRI